MTNKHEIIKLPSTSSMTVLQSFPLELCSLICQDPILERLDLSSICFISHAFRNEAEGNFPTVFHVFEVPLSQKKPHLAIKIKGLALLLPRPSALRVNDVVRLTRKLFICVNCRWLFKYVIGVDLPVDCKSICIRHRLICCRLLVIDSS